MANPSLSEYLAQSQRGLYQSVFGPEYMMKQTYFTSADADFNVNPENFTAIFLYFCYYISTI